MAACNDYFCIFIVAKRKSGTIPLFNKEILDYSFASFIGFGYYANAILLYLQSFNGIIL